MRIAAASDDGENLTQHFGRSRYFLISEVETGGKIRRLETRAKPACAGSGDSCHQDGNHQAILDAIRDCDAVISRGIGQQMLEKLTRAGKEVRIMAQPTVAEAVAEFARGSAF